jgi:hypothetical protein
MSKGMAEPVEIRLTRVSEPPTATLKTLASPLPRAEERALARELLEPMLLLYRAGALGIAGPSVIPALARVDPARVLDMVENRTIADPSSSLIQVVLAQFEDDPAAAIATIEADRDPGWRASGWLALESFRPAPDRARRQSFLERAHADAEQAVSNPVKLRLLGVIADRWLELGSLEHARPILLQGREIVTAWPKNEWFFEAEEFANVLAVIDLPAAIALFERRGRTNVSQADAASVNRHKGEAAIRLAGIDPATAEGLIAPPSVNFHERPRVVLTVARKMANVDLTRARRLLETLDDGSSPGLKASPALVPFGLGAIAGELARTDPDQARALLDEAFAGLRNITLDGGPRPGQDSAANLMAELLPIVERLDPQRLAERTWLVAASRAPSVLEPRPQELEGTFALAMLVARYDREIADVIASAALGRLPDLLGDSSRSWGNTIPTIFKSLTAYDPRAIAPLLRALPDAVRKPPPRPDAFTAVSIESQLRLAAAQILGFPNEVRPTEAGRIGYATLPYRQSD